MAEQAQDTPHFLFVSVREHIVLSGCIPVSYTHLILKAKLKAKGDAAMRTEQLRYLLLLEQHHSLTKIGNKLGVSYQTVDFGLRGLEQELDVYKRQPYDLPDQHYDNGRK